MKTKSKRVVRSKLIYVTAKDIKNGVICDPHSCPIANALMRTFKPVRVCVITGVSISVDKDSPFNYTKFGELPIKALQWRRDFDCKRPVKPFKFKLTYNEPNT
jgi:hypothetical protein